MSIEEAPPPYEILEHTADIGLRARGRTQEELFENAAWGLTEILDAGRSPRDGQGRRVAGGGFPRSSREARASGGAGVNSRLVHLRGEADVEALLVDWMNELILLTEEGKACIAGVDVESVADGSLRAQIELIECDPVPEGTELKATTYHQLSVRPAEDGWQATVFFDV